ncbi:MAG TPA: hypothetical protein VGB13_11460 [Candidatus Krumholzibacteria bacterium]|jgi:hypothetical protein
MYVFTKGVHHAAIEKLHRRGSALERTRMTEEFTLEHDREPCGEQAIPFYLVDPNQKIQLLTRDWPEPVDDGRRLAGLVHPVDA